MLVDVASLDTRAVHLIGELRRRLDIPVVAIVTAADEPRATVALVAGADAVLRAADLPSVAATLGALARRRSRDDGEDRPRSVAAGPPRMMWICSPDRRCTAVNRGWLVFRGRTLRQELDRGWLDGVHPEDRADVTTRLESAGAGLPFTLEYRARRHDGAWRNILDSAAVLQAPDQTLLGYIGVRVDVTDAQDSPPAATPPPRTCAGGPSRPAA